MAIGDATFKPPPTAQQALAPGPKRRSPCWVWADSCGLRSPGESGNSDHRPCSAGRRRIGRCSGNPAPDRAARSRAGTEQGRRRREGSGVSLLSAGVLPRAASRGRCRTRLESGSPAPGLTSAYTRLQRPGLEPRSGKLSFLGVSTLLSPRLGPGPDLSD